MLDHSKFEDIAGQFHDAKTEEEADMVISENVDVIALNNKADRKLGRVGMPLYAKTLDSLQENKYYDKARAVKDIAVLGAAVTFAVTAGKWAYGLIWG